ncbi:hypothetical protein KC19_VG005000 [Ceratodon purpureus]|uniref:Uncharacterized protein n=1 Tax=Ceratodon purpureus TaxID=3225 RepID=A0A8T0HKN4_CERPU|nr:hypothetical protein KC19_VG005000 [Ceratodon purpureus]
MCHCHFSPQNALHAGNISLFGTTRRRVHRVFLRSHAEEMTEGPSEHDCESYHGSVLPVSSGDEGAHGSPSSSKRKSPPADVVCIEHAAESREDGDFSILQWLKEDVYQPPPMSEELRRAKRREILLAQREGPANIHVAANVDHHVNRGAVEREIQGHTADTTLDLCVPSSEEETSHELRTEKVIDIVPEVGGNPQPAQLKYIPLDVRLRRLLNKKRN